MAGIYTTLTPVLSSNIWGVGWVPWSTNRIGYLEVEFLSGSLYLYSDVPKIVYDHFMIAPSKGKYFWQYIRCQTTDCSGSAIPYAYVRLR